MFLFNPSRKLFKAVSWGQKDKIENLLKKGADINFLKKCWIITDGKDKFINLDEKITPLINSLFHGIDEEVLDFLIDNGADIDKETNKGNTALIFTIEHLGKFKLYVNNLKIDRLTYQLKYMKYFLEKGANVNHENADGKSPLYYALRYPHKKFVEKLLAYGANFQTLSSDDINNFLIAELSTNDMKWVEKLLANGAKPKEISKDTLDRLLLDAQLLNQNQDEKIKFLKEIGASINKKDVNEAIRLNMNNLEKIKKLVNLGADINITFYYYGANEKPLMHAIKHKYNDIAKYLLDFGAEIDSEGIYGTPLILSIQQRNYALAEKIIQKGANCDLKDKSGKSAIEYAIYDGNVNLFNMIIDHCSEIPNLFNAIPGYYFSSGTFSNIIQNTSKMPHETNKKAYYEIVNKLIELGADVNEKFKKPINFGGRFCGKSTSMATISSGRPASNSVPPSLYGIDSISSSTPLMWASRFGHLEIAKLLIQNGADVNATTVGNWTALMFATIDGFTEIVELLLENNAKVLTKNHQGQTAYNLAKYCGASPFHPENPPGNILREATKKAKN